MFKLISQFELVMHTDRNQPSFTFAPIGYMYSYVFFPPPPVPKPMIQNAQRLSDGHQINHHICLKFSDMTFSAVNYYLLKKISIHVYLFF